jgi:hypothetical protein
VDDESGHTRDSPLIAKDALERQRPGARRRSHIADPDIPPDVFQRHEKYISRKK